MSKIPVGAQLFSARESLKTKEEITRTLERLREGGYTLLQLSGFSYEVDFIKALCERLGLTVGLTHISPERILDDTQTVIAEHKSLGCPYVGLGGLPGAYRDGIEGAERFLTEFRPAMEALHAADLKFQYHNHKFEFERYDGLTLLEQLAQRSDPELMGFTLDTYWAQAGGVDVSDFIRKLNGRIDVCHYKDLAIVKDSQRFAPVGSGNMNWKAIISAFEEVGVKMAFVEQDECYDRDPVDCLLESLRFLNQR